MNTLLSAISNFVPQINSSKGLLFRCLNTGHMIGSCSAEEGCSVDGCKRPNHHSLLHMPLKDSEGETRPAVLQSICSSKEEKGKLP